MQPGDALRVQMSKWGGQPHWAYDARYLGQDEHGSWIGSPAGTAYARPGLAFDSEVDNVTLLPDRAWCCPTLYAPGLWCDVYVDISTPPVLADGTVTAVDLDLDVIRMAINRCPVPPRFTAGPGEVFVDDEDEFAEHRAELGYPDHVVAAALESCATVLAAVRSARAPFDGPTGHRWLTALAALSP